MGMDGKPSAADLATKGQDYAHRLTDGATTANINIRISSMDADLQTMSPANRQQVLTAMDKELTDRGLLPSALQVFAEQNDYHNILKADRRGIHGDTLGYNLDPTNNQSKFPGGHTFDANSNPVELMLTRDLKNNIGSIAPGDDDEVTFGRLNKFARQATERNANAAGATAMLKEFDNGNGFYGLSHNKDKIQKQDIENARSFSHDSQQQATLDFMSNHFKELSEHGGITPGSMRRFAAKNGVDYTKVEAPTPATAPPYEKGAQPAPTVKPDSTSHVSAAEAQDAAKIKAKDTHAVKAGETLKSIAIEELKAQGKISETATPRDLALAHKQIAYEEHLIRLYNPKIFAHLPNYDGRLQPTWSFNLVPDSELQQELNANKLKYHPIKPEQPVQPVPPVPAPSNG